LLSAEIAPKLGIPQNLRAYEVQSLSSFCGCAVQRGHGNICLHLLML